MKIYHNPRCSKSRQTLEIIRSKSIEPEIILYMEVGLSEEIIKFLLVALNFSSARELMRRGEKDYKELKLKDADDEDLPKKAQNHVIFQRNN